MSRSKAELSQTDREILTLVIYRTQHQKYRTFFGTNEYVAKSIGIQPDTVRKAISKLVKLGYLIQDADAQGRRHLAYSGKNFVPIIADMRNINKKTLKDDEEYFEREAADAKRELYLSQLHIETLEKEVSELRNQLWAYQMHIYDLERLFTAYGVTKEQINSMVQQMKEMEDAKCSLSE